MNWYKPVQAVESPIQQRASKYHRGQNVIVYASDTDSRTGEILDSQYFTADDEYVYQVKFDEPNEIFKEDKRFKEKDIIPY